MNPIITVTKSDGTSEPFDESKLVSSLRHAGARDAVIEDVVEEVKDGMKDGVTTTDIYREAFALLRSHHAPVAAKYSVRRALLELGPDGFPFEKFVARIFRAWGYETLTDQIVLGACVEHEMDVVAWKDDELAMCEAKYHNTFGVKSDVKVALYVKARFDDIAQTDFDYGGRTRRLSQKGHWLVTNTKFTEMAVKYGECNNLNMLGWNYPAQGHLHDLIARYGLHPITCIATLTHQHKKDLIGRDILTCLDLIGSPGALHDVGIHGDLTEKILTEAQLIIEQGK